MSSVIWRATVVRENDGLVWIVAPRYLGDEELGPLPVHGSAKAGDKVLLMLLGGSSQDMIVLPEVHSV